MTTPIPAVILAGGAGRRLGRGEKALVTLGDRPLIDHVRARLQSQVDPLALSLRTRPPWALNLGLPILEDLPSPDRGPLGGIAATLVWAASLTPQPEWVITTPVDVPFLPTDLCVRLTGSKADADVAVAASGGQSHHAIAAWRPTLANQLLLAIRDEALSIRRFQSSVRTIEIDWPVTQVDPFMNINTPEDLQTAERSFALLNESDAIPAEGSRA